MKKIIHCLLSLLILTGALIATTQSSIAADKPHVVLIYIDDLGYGDVGCYDCEDIPTPHVDRLAKEGMICHNALVTSTVCTPSRYTFLTGRYASSSHSNTFLDECPKGTQALPAFNVGLESDRMNVGRVMADAGYATGFVGKYHVHDTDHSKEASLFGDLDVPKNAEYSVSGIPIVSNK